MKYITILILLIIIKISSFAQVGINTITPDSSAILDVRSNEKGMLIPTFTTSNRYALENNQPLTGLADGLLVFDTDDNRFYFWNRDISKWVVVNNWIKDYTSTSANDDHIIIDLENTSNVGIDTINPNSQLTVNGNMSVGSNVNIAPTDGLYVEGRVLIGYSGTNPDKLVVNGNTHVEDTCFADKFKGIGVVPVGTVIMYYGDISTTYFYNDGKGKENTKMYGWAICNGNYTTPDLRGRFIVGVGSQYSLNNKAGENKVKLSINEMPTHNHTGTGYTSYNGAHTHTFRYKTHDHYKDGDENFSIVIKGSGSGKKTGWGGAHGHTATAGNKGGDQTHENRPSYYAVYYIMRIN